MRGLPPYSGSFLLLGKDEPPQAVIGLPRLAGELIADRYHEVLIVVGASVRGSRVAAGLALGRPFRGEKPTDRIVGERAVRYAGRRVSNSVLVVTLHPAESVVLGLCSYCAQARIGVAHRGFH